MMHQETGKIIKHEDYEKLDKEKKSKYFQVPEADKYNVHRMNRAERRAYAKQQRNKK